MTEQKPLHFHICQSIAGLEHLMKRGTKIDWLLNDDDRPATYDELRAAIREAKAKGYTVLPPCDNVNAIGHCQGHESIDEMDVMADTNLGNFVEKKLSKMFNGGNPIVIPIEELESNIEHIKELTEAAEVAAKMRSDKNECR